MSDAVTRLNAALSGRYTIERELGEGGMATVYLADDLKHERKVALKVLRPELAAVVGAERFLAEIKTTANLQHPHILPLFDSGEADNFLFYVMPYVEGESLRERLDREKQLGVEDSLAITQKVAGALDLAHSHGVVHRDIKPANILLSEQGEPLIADFGIALAVAQAGGGRITETGLSLGTPHYMSPEQATGERDVDQRSDVYALGCVLYEMLAGEPPFSASTPQAVLAKILTVDAPSITVVRRTVPPNVGNALAKSLEKLPADRFTSASEFATALRDEGYTYQPRSLTRAMTEHAEPTVPATPVATTGTRGPWLQDRRFVASLLVGATMTALAAWRWLGGASGLTDAADLPFRAGASDFELRAPGGTGARLAIADDGSQIAVASFVEGVSRIFLRRSDERDFEEISGTDRASYPEFSPDGEWLLFEDFGQSKIYKVQLSVSDSPPIHVADGSFPHWPLNDTIVFQGVDGGIYQVSPEGDNQTLILEASSVGDRSASLPHLLPDGKAVLFQGRVDDHWSVMLVEIESREVYDLELTGSNPRYVSSGHIVYGHESEALMAVPFNLDTHKVTGQEGTALPEVRVFDGGAMQFAVSETGTAVIGLPTGVARRLVIVDLDGNETPVPIPENNFNNPRFSPDGRYIAYEIGYHIWVHDQQLGGFSPLTTEGINLSPVWSSDNRYVYFASRRTGTLNFDVFRHSVDGSEASEPVFLREGRNYPLSVFSSGSQLLVGERTDDPEMDLVIASEGPDGWEFNVYQGATWSEAFGSISPDERRVLYQANETNETDGEIFVRSFSDALNFDTVASGYHEPIWAPDGTAIYFRGRGRVMRATVTAGDPIRVGPPQELFEDRWLRDSRFGVTPSWDVHVHPEGDRFVFSHSRGLDGANQVGEPVIPIEYVTNWFDELRERVPN